MRALPFILAVLLAAAGLRAEEVGLPPIRLNVTRDEMNAPATPPLLQLSPEEKAHYGLSPFLNDTNQNGIPDVSVAASWEFFFNPDDELWKTQWTPDHTGTYRFVLESEQPLQLKINDVLVPAFQPNTFEVVGMLPEQTTVELAPTQGQAPPPRGRLTAYFIDGLDSDGDGLSLDWEMQLHTDPTKADTDGDGLSDGEEVIKYGTDPLSADSNHNGIPDYVEVVTQPALFAVDREGFWEIKGDSLASRNPTKALTYRMPFPYAGIYRLGVVTHPTSTGNGTLKFYVDGTFQAAVQLVAGPGPRYQWVELMLPKPVAIGTGLPTILHSVRVEWENKAAGVDAGELLIEQVYLDYIDNQPESAAASGTPGKP